MNKTSKSTLRVCLRFYGDLKDLLYSKHDRTGLERILPEPTSVKDLIEGCGVPHTEVDLILVNGISSGFSHLIKGGEFVSVYPFFNTVEIPEANRLQQRKLPNPRFVVDVNLGKLARYLRMAGFDTAYQNHSKDEELIETMLEEDRALLTRDRKLLMHNVVKTGYLPRSNRGEEQLEEILKRFGLFGAVNPFTRCIHCNGVLKSVDKKKILNQLEPLTKKHYEQFSQCPDCEQIYWRGSHRTRLHPNVQEILKLG